MTQLARADALAAAAGLVTGEADEGVPAVLVRGLNADAGPRNPAAALIRPLAEDLFRRSDRVVVLTGGVGGAKLLLGLNHVVSSNEITAIVNTADDFRHLGFWISPDIDTVLYTHLGSPMRYRAGGRANETWTFMKVLSCLVVSDGLHRHGRSVRCTPSVRACSPQEKIEFHHRILRVAFWHRVGDSSDE